MFFVSLSLSLLLQVSALEAPPLAQLRPLCDQGVANKTLIRASAVVHRPGSPARGPGAPLAPREPRSRPGPGAPHGGSVQHRIKPALTI